MIYVHCKQCGADLSDETFIRNVSPDKKSMEIKINPGHKCPDKNAQDVSLTPLQKQEVEQMIMRALATGSV